jgi:hypothetical protein
VSPFDGMMEAPDNIIKLYHNHSENFSHLDHLFQETHYKLQCDLNVMMNFDVKKVITSKYLLKYGFDDSQEVPEKYDFF